MAGEQRGSKTEIFTGYYRSGFEVSYFRPAGTNEVWWLSARAGLELPCDRSASCYLVVRGQLGGRGPQGHLSSYKRELWVTDVNRASTSQCQCEGDLLPGGISKAMVYHPRYHHSCPRLPSSSDCPCVPHAVMRFHQCAGLARCARTSRSDAWLSGK